MSWLLLILIVSMHGSTMKSFLMLRYHLLSGLRSVSFPTVFPATILYAPLFYTTPTVVWLKCDSLTACSRICGLSVFQYRRNLHWSKEKLEEVPLSPLPKNDVCSFLRSTEDCPLYSGLRSPKTRFLHLFLSLVSSSGCSCLVVQAVHNVKTHGDAWEGKWRGNRRLERVATTLAMCLGT
jgi:hypothetical protein